MMSKDAIAAGTTTTRSCESLTVALPDGRALGARRWPGRGVPLVLLHGMLDSCEGWDAVVDATDRPCLTIDLPGFGRSDLPSRPRLSAYAEDVLVALEQLNTAVTIVGHSLGGGVAAVVAEKAPDRVTALVLLAPV